jgi:hypothetical protein
MNDKSILRTARKFARKTAEAIRLEKGNPNTTFARKRGVRAK